VTVPIKPDLPWWALLEQIGNRTNALLAQAPASVFQGVANIPADLADFFDFAAPRVTPQRRVEPAPHGSTTTPWRERTRRLREMAAPEPKTLAEHAVATAGNLYGGIAGFPSGLGQFPTLRTVSKAAPKATKAARDFVAVPHEEFTAALQRFAKDRPDEAGFITYHSPETMAADGMQTFLSPDGKTGFAVAADGDIRNVFNAGAKGGGAKAVAEAVTHYGGKKLDAFDTNLGNFYRDFGFKETQRLPWDDQYRPAAWNEAKYGKPDVMFMEYGGGAKTPEEALSRYESARIARRGSAPHTSADMPTAPMPQEPEKIIKAAIELPGKDGAGYRFEGDTHFGAILDAMDSGAIDEGDLERVLSQPFVKQGFLTNTGRFVNRDEAEELAKRAGLYARDAESTNPAKGLRSEDIAELPPAPPALSILQAEKPKRAKVTALEAAKALVQGRKPLTGSKPHIQRVAAIRRGLAEVEAALRKPGNALEWYRTAVADMEDHTRHVFPTTQNPEDMGVFKAVLAITSNGQKVDANYKTAAQVFDRYLKTGRLEMGEGVMRSPRWRTHEKQLRKLQGMIEEKGKQGTIDYLLGETNVLKRDTRMEPTAAAEFGPKIGRFFGNLNGQHGEVTVDLWATRTWRRWMGDVKTRVDRKTGKVVLDDAPDANEKRQIRGIMSELADSIVARSGKKVAPADVQALLWFYEQELHRSKGAKNVSESFAEAAKRYRDRVRQLGLAVGQ
jgi:hypothetical protein